MYYEIGCNLYSADQTDLNLLIVLSPTPGIGIGTVPRDIGDRDPIPNALKILHAQLSSQARPTTQIKRLMHREEKAAERLQLVRLFKDNRAPCRVMSLFIRHHFHWGNQAKLVVTEWKGVSLLEPVQRKRRSSIRAKTKLQPPTGQS